MEFIATLVALGFALSSLIGAFRWIERATAQSPDPGVHRAKRGFYLAFAGIIVLVAATFGILYAASPYGHIFAGNLAMGVFLAGLVPLCHWLALAQIRAMGLAGEGPVILSRESRRKIRPPLIGGTLMGVLAAAVLIWFGPRAAPADDDPLYAVWLAFGLTFAGAGWPMFVVRRCVERDRAAARNPPFAGA
jgi:hypothetical protein